MQPADDEQPTTASDIAGGDRTTTTRRGGGYSPSPRPVFDRPTLVTASTVTQHIWGNSATNHVADWIIASTDRIHALVFGLAPGGRFVHSEDFRTVFGADEVLTVLRGRMILANPETGEVQPVDTGESICFGKDTWHHAFAHGTEELRVLELFAPPPSTGSSGAYARGRPYLEAARYADDSILGRWPAAKARVDEAATLRPVEPGSIHYRLAGDALVGVLSSTDHLTVARVAIPPGGASVRQERGGDEMLYGVSGVTHVRAWHGDDTFVFEVRPDEACFLPAGCVHEYRNFTGAESNAIIGVAPHFLPQRDS